MEVLTVIITESVGAITEPQVKGISSELDINDLANIVGSWAMGHGCFILVTFPPCWIVRNRSDLLEYHIRSPKYRSRKAWRRRWYL